MKYFYGENERNNYFEGWYFKHRSINFALSIIPAYHINSQGIRRASIQIITNEQTYAIDYPASAFYAAKDRLFIRIGNNIFYEHGCRLDINNSEICLKGDLLYGRFRPLAYDIMGPFSKLPHMQCRHSVVSMAHRVAGNLTLNGQPLHFQNGSGYIEGDRGHDFPRKYRWLQCEEMDSFHFSIMTAIADIPIRNTSFTGCICAISYRGSQYRLATYLGVKIRKNEENEILLTQKKYKLLIQFDSQCDLQPGSENQSRAVPLNAPIRGSMDRTIYECLMGNARFRFWHDKTLIFDITSPHTSIENVDTVDNF